MMTAVTAKDKVRLPRHPGPRPARPGELSSSTPEPVAGRQGWPGAPGRSKPPGFLSWLFPCVNVPSRICPSASSFQNHPGQGWQGPPLYVHRSDRNCPKGQSQAPPCPHTCGREATPPPPPRPSKPPPPAVATGLPPPPPTVPRLWTSSGSPEPAQPPAREMTFAKNAWPENLGLTVAP